MEKKELLALVGDGFQKPAWHGPNLRTELRGVTALEALWRPSESRHNIWEIVLHAAYWKHTVKQRLTGSRKRDFPEKGRNWFIRDGAKLAKGEAEKRWKNDLELLARTHEELRDAIENLNEGDLKRSTLFNRQSAIRNVTGIAMHDIYHAGQIQLLRKLREKK